MLQIRFCPRDCHYCNWKSLTSVNNNSSASYGEIRACSQIANVLDLSNVKKKQECFRKNFFRPIIKNAFKNKNRLAMLTS